MRRSLATLAALMLMAGCGSTVRGAATRTAASGDPEFNPAAVSGSTATTASAGDVAAGPSAAPASGRAKAGAATASTVAGPPPTGPLKVGYLSTKASNAPAAGLNTGETVSGVDIFQALVRAMNKSGGIAGRRLEPVIAVTDTASANWDVDYAAACEQFTHDNRVVAVLGYSFGYFEAFEKCLTDAKIVHLTGGYAVGDITAFERFPYMFATSHPTDDRRLLLQLKGAVDAGLLTPARSVGRLTDDCPSTSRANKRTIEPYIQRAHINVVATTVMSCPSGASDVTFVVSQIQSAQLQFRSRNVDTVVAEGIPVVLFAANAQAQGWHPDYLLTSAAGGAALEPNIPAQQAEKMHGFGWFSPIDVNSGNQPPRTASQQRCFTMLAGENIRPTQYNDFVSAFTSCDALFLYEAALKATGARSDAEAVRAAIGAMGAGYKGVSTLDARSTFSLTKRDAPAAYRRFDWATSCNCFRYTSAALPFD